MWKKLLLILGFLVALVAGFLLALAVVALWDRDGSLALGERLGVVEVEGFIGDARPAVEALRAFRQDDEVRAVVLRVETPGGVIGPSQEIHDEVKRTAAVKPVVVSMGALAASGGYYISAPATRIVANPGTVTGSIGVILQLKEVHVLFDKLGLRSNVVKSGPLKDAGSPTRKMTEEDRAVFQTLVDDLFGQFVDAVAEGRNMDREKVLALADGRVFSGRAAKQNGLVDDLGGFWEAVRIAQEAAGLEGEPELEYRRRRPRGVLRWVLGDDSGALSGLDVATAAPIRYVLPNW